MEHKDEQGPDPESPTPPDSEKRPYQAPKVESVQLSKEAAESLT